MDGYVPNSVPQRRAHVVFRLCPSSGCVPLPAVACSASSCRRRLGGRVPSVGSKGQKPRKPNQHHLPPVGSKENLDYEFQQRRKEVFGGWPLWLAAGILVLALVGWLFVTI